MALSPAVAANDKDKSSLVVDGAVEGIVCERSGRLVEISVVVRSEFP